MFPKIKYIFIACILLPSCNNDSFNHKDKKGTIKSEQDSIIILKQRVAELEIKVKKLSFPADQRITEIKKLIDEDNLDTALDKITELKSLFPNSSEVKNISVLTETIDRKKAEITAEQERIKALGFKALKAVSNIQIDYNRIVFSKANIGLKYIHDVYPTYSGSSWFEHTADRGNNYLSFAMDITSDSKEPMIPIPAFYEVIGDKLIYVSTFRVDFARWDDYGTYLGNEHDLKNDFRKVSTVKFKVGAEISKESLSKPYLVAVKNSNCLERHYDRFRNPPVWYSGNANYPYSLTLDDFNNGSYFVIKIANL